MRKHGRIKNTGGKIHESRSGGDERWTMTQSEEEKKKRKRRGRSENREIGGKRMRAKKVKWREIESKGGRERERERTEQYLVGLAFLWLSYHSVMSG